MRPVLWRVIKWASAVLLIALFVYLNWDYLQHAGEQWRTIDLRFEVLAFCIYLPCLILTFVRWFLLVRAAGLPFRLMDAIRLSFIGYFFSIVLPGSVTGDLVRAGMLARQQERRTLAVATIFVDRLIGLLGLIVLVSFLAAFFWHADWVEEEPVLRGIILFVWATTGALFLATVLLAVLPLKSQPVIDLLNRVPKIGRILAEAARALQMYRHKVWYVALALLMAAIGHVGFVLSFYCSARAVAGPTPSLEKHYLIIPVGFVVQAVPLTPGNLGVAEEAYKRLYHIADPALENSNHYSFKGGWSSLWQRVVTWCIALIGLGFYLPVRRTVRKVLKESKAEILLDPTDGKGAPEPPPVKGTHEAVH